MVDPALQIGTMQEARALFVRRKQLRSQDLEDAVGAVVAIAREPDLRGAAVAQPAQQRVPSGEDLPACQSHCQTWAVTQGFVGPGRRPVRRTAAGRRRQAGLVLVEFLEQLAPFRVLLLGRALELQRAALDVHDHRLHLGLEGIAELLQRLGVGLDLGALVEARLERVDAADHGRGRRGRGRAAAAVAARDDAADDRDRAEHLAGDRLPPRLRLRLEFLVAVLAPVRVGLGHGLAEIRVVLVQRVDQRVVPLADALHALHDRVVRGRQARDRVVALAVHGDVLPEGVRREVRGEAQPGDLVQLHELLARQACRARRACRSQACCRGSGTGHAAATRRPCRRACRPRPGTACGTRRARWRR